MKKKKISILGSTGSIGVSALDVIKQHPDRFEITSLAAGSNVELLASQIKEFSPCFVSVKNDEARSKLEGLLGGNKIEILTGEMGLIAVAIDEHAEMVISSLVGAVGLKPTYEAIIRGKSIALANKETLVAAGPVMMKAIKENNVTVLPVDSEHSAIFQSLIGHSKKDIKRIVLTASGGPFYNYTGDLAAIKPEQALKHPNWSMGAKITIDSATMINKGLEIIEAHWLFDMPMDKIDVLVHPQSIVHSMVEYIDGSVVAQMANPDMRCPIAYAIAYPDRVTTNVKCVDWASLKTLDFFEPNHERLRGIVIAREAAKIGGSMPAAMNAANEIAVEAFLKGKIKFTDIYKIISDTMNAHDPKKLSTVDDVVMADNDARDIAKGLIAKL